MNLFSFLYDFAIIVAAGLLMVTALARLNDIKRDQNSKRWWFRRLGLLMVFTSMVLLVASYWTMNTPGWQAVQKIMGLWGFLITWITTPPAPDGHPPWHKLITRYDPK